MYDVIPETSLNALDCGPTCLKMLLAYYGQEVDLDTLIKECNVRLVGCSAGDIIRVGKLHGLDAMVAYYMDADEVIRQDRPSIVHWKYLHWCICCGQDDNGNVVICNPDRGRYRMSKALFTSFYSGVAIFNGEPSDLPDPPEQATAEDYEAALGRLGVSV